MSNPIEFVKNSWEQEIYTNSGQIDPYNEYDWESIAMGFALGRGLDAVDSHKFVQELRKEDLL